MIEFDVFFIVVVDLNDLLNVVIYIWGLCKFYGVFVVVFDVSFDVL